MIKDTLENARKIVELLKEKGKIWAENEASPAAKLFRTCQTFETLDYISFAQDMRKLALSATQKDADSGATTRRLWSLKNRAEKFLQQHVVPYEGAKTHLRRNDEENADDLIFMFWRIPELLPYAPTMTMLALIQGIPYEIFRDTDLWYVELKNSGKISVNAAELCEGLEKLIDDWKKSTNYRSKRYRDKKPFCDEKTLHQDFWQMVLFMKMQQELAKYIKNSSFCEENNIDLNAFFQDFCELWPYSPQLFLPIDEKESRSVDEWKSMVDYFFNNADQYQRSRMVDVIKAAKEFASEEMIPLAYSETFLIDDGQWALLEDPDEQRWLVPGTPYFAAYYFIDDFKIYGMLHYKDIGDKYKEKIINIVQYDIDIYNWTNNWTNNCLYQVLAGEKLKKPSMRKSIDSDRTKRKAWSENVIKREIRSKYWEILENTYRFLLTSQEPTPFKIEMYEKKNILIRGECQVPIIGEVTLPKLRMVQYLRLEEVRQDTKTQDSSNTCLPKEE